MQYKKVLRDVIQYKIPVTVIYQGVELSGAIVEADIENDRAGQITLSVPRESGKGSDNAVIPFMVGSYPIVMYDEKKLKRAIAKDNEVKEDVDDDDEGNE